MLHNFLYFLYIILIMKRITMKMTVGKWELRNRIVSGMVVFDNTK